ncbi:MAG: hypothetical protein HN919_10095 [Verrucomicrobia bacterium]|jgi:hypothetical protein|nr:hypothetical protein [Verrucomicrobiota bacterium]MBT7702031.1 hypothetical protein [Verrucomicrobiota bacterium]
MKKSDPLLKAAFMEVVENQIRDDDPPETRATLKRLTSQGVSDDDARIYIGQAVCVEVWDILRNKKEFNMVRYVRNLKNLPDEPQE